MTPNQQQIVIAWVTSETRFVGTYGAHPGSLPREDDYEAYTRPHAVMWLRTGDAGDVDRAKAQTTSIHETARVYTYDAAISDPLDRARRDVMVDRGVDPETGYDPFKGLD